MQESDREGQFGGGEDLRGERCPREDPGVELPADVSSCEWRGIACTECDHHEARHIVDGERGEIHGLRHEEHEPGEGLAGDGQVREAIRRSGRALVRHGEHHEVMK